MRMKAKVLQKLYQSGKVTQEGLHAAVEDGVITQEEYEAIIGANAE